MGHGWKSIRTQEVSRKKCQCGEGVIITYVDIQESDYSMDERSSPYIEVVCHNGCK